MATIGASGNSRAKVTSDAEIDAQLEEFAALVREAVLINGREFNLQLNFYANQITDGDENPSLLDF